MVSVKSSASFAPPEELKPMNKCIPGTPQKSPPFSTPHPVNPHHLASPESWLRAKNIMNIWKPIEKFPCSRFGSKFSEFVLIFFLFHKIRWPCSCFRKSLVWPLGLFQGAIVCQEYNPKQGSNQKNKNIIPTSKTGRPKKYDSRRGGFWLPTGLARKNLPNQQHIYNIWKVGSARWVCSSYKWSYNPYKWPYTWLTVLISP